MLNHVHSYILLFWHYFPGFCNFEKRLRVLSNNNVFWWKFPPLHCIQYLFFIHFTAWNIFCALFVFLLATLVKILLHLFIFVKLSFLTRFNSVLQLQNPTPSYWRIFNFSILVSKVVNYIFIIFCLSLNLPICQWYLKLLLDVCNVVIRVQPYCENA